MKYYYFEIVMKNVFHVHFINPLLHNVEKWPNIL